MALDLAWDETGDGPPLVVLHGMFGSATNWRGIAQRLGALSRVYCVDLRNHGRSPWQDTMSYPEMAADVLRFLDARRLERPALLGHSMGGKVAMALALTAPERVGPLIIADIAPVAYHDRMSGYVSLMRAIDLVPGVTRAAVRHALAAAIPEPGVVAFLLQNLVAEGDRLRWRIHLDAIGQAMPQLRAFADELRTRRFAGQVTAIVGANSSYVQPPAAARFAPMFPSVHVVTLADAGHWLHAEQPAAFVDAVLHAMDSPAKFDEEAVAETAAWPE